MAGGAGTVIGGRFRLIELLGQGGMGRVWRGRDEFLGRDVAVKEVRLSADLPGEARAALVARAVREAQSAGRLNHPGIVTIHDVVEHDGAPWIVMEYVPGKSLAARVAADGPLPWRQAAQAGAKIAEALAHAHAAGVVHRDLKPDNILVHGDRVVITDFGIARIADSASRLTSAGTVIGTPHFMAPEQLEGSQAGPAADMWSLGATLYAVVEGRPPFDGPTLTAVVTAVLARDPVPPVHLGPIAGLVMQLLGKDPAGRPAAAEAVRAFGGVLAATAGTAEATIGAQPPRTGQPPATQAGVPEAMTETVSRDGVPTGPGFPRSSPADRRPRTPAPGTRRPIYLAGGAVLVVVIVAVALVLVKLNGGSGTAGAAGSTGSTSSSAESSAAPAQLTSQVTGVPVSVTDEVGGGGISSGSFVSAPTSSAIQAASALGAYFAAVGGKPLVSDGKPEVLFMSGEYCPYCAAGSWALVNALSRFGTFTGLRTISSSGTDIYPDTPGFTFYGATYASRYISFTPVELFTSYREGHSASTSVPYVKLQVPTAAQTAVSQAYDPEGAIPFTDLGNKYAAVGNLAPLSPQLLAGKTWAQVAAAMNEPSSALGRAEIGNANYLTAAVCELTGNEPASACTAVVRSLEPRL